MAEHGTLKAGDRVRHPSWPTGATAIVMGVGEVRDQRHARLDRRMPVGPQVDGASAMASFWDEAGLEVVADLSSRYLTFLGMGHVYPLALGESVLPLWIETVSFQQQSVLALALRGPDGVRKYHPAKEVHRAYRGTMLRAAARGRFLYWGEKADDFMTMEVIADEAAWRTALRDFFHSVDELPHHYVAHLAHAAQIIACKHPHPPCAQRWGMFYAKWCDDLHVTPETEAEMDARLGDWGTAAERLAGLRDERERDADQG